MSFIYIPNSQSCMDAETTPLSYFSFSDLFVPIIKYVIRESNTAYYFLFAGNGDLSKEYFESCLVKQYNIPTSPANQFEIITWENLNLVHYGINENLDTDLLNYYGSVDTKTNRIAIMHKSKYTRIGDLDLYFITDESLRYLKKDGTDKVFITNQNNLLSRSKYQHEMVFNTTKTYTLFATVQLSSGIVDQFFVYPSKPNLYNANALRNAISNMYNINMAKLGQEETSKLIQIQLIPIPITYVCNDLNMTYLIKNKQVAVLNRQTTHVQFRNYYELHPEYSSFYTNSVPKLGPNSKIYPVKVF